MVSSCFCRRVKSGDTERKMNATTTMSTIMEATKNHPARVSTEKVITSAATAMRGTGTIMRIAWVIRVCTVVTSEDVRVVMEATPKWRKSKIESFIDLA